ncbi:MAG: hypothetical protein J0H55_04860 [Chitinophagaceae bacterium]|nr:hypothetical protein [Chitinophagaceae bacterium]
MKIPIHIAEKLLRLFNGEYIPSSQARHALIDQLVLDGILQRSGRIQKTLWLTDREALKVYLKNHLAISDLEEYIRVSNMENVSRSELVKISSDSKLSAIRTFKGFLINCYSPVRAKIGTRHVIIKPENGTFQFIYDYENFIPSADVTIVGIENPENFRYVQKQKYLFNDIFPLFVSRYPQSQSKDLIDWLQKIPNGYLHFGDFDFAGIGIYLNEFKKYLSEKSAFFIPENFEKLIKEFGNRKRYDIQKINFDPKKIREENLIRLIQIIHKYRKGLDQEILICK